MVNVSEEFNEEHDNIFQGYLESIYTKAWEILDKDVEGLSEEEVIIRIKLMAAAMALSTYKIISNNTIMSDETKAEEITYLYENVHEIVKDELAELQIDLKKN